MRLLKWFTRDDAENGRARTIYTTEQLGEKQALTPEGFLVINDVPIARTGTMQYRNGETPIPAGPKGYVDITRDEDAVFHPDYLASLIGKPVCDEHPSSKIVPETWKGLAVGAVLNPRRGSGVQTDLLVADFIIYDTAAIAAIQAGKREVSVGYECDYEETGPGAGRQTNLIANHVALVHAGRCGNRCAIGDELPSLDLSGDQSMYTRDNKPTLKAIVSRIITAFTTKDEATMKKELETLSQVADEDGGGSATHIHLGGGSEGGRQMKDEDIEARFASLESGHQQIIDGMAQIMGRLDGTTKKEGEDGGDPDPDAEAAAAAAAEEAAVGDEMAEEAPAGKAEDARMAKDSAMLKDSFQQTIADAEILAPGIRFPAFDSKAAPKTGIEVLTRFRLSALELAYATADGRALIEEVTGGKPMALDCKCVKDVRTTFRAAAALRKRHNNDRGTIVEATLLSNRVPVMSIADLNKRNREFFAAKH